MQGTQTATAKKRMPFPDIMRGFAILCVVLGHCIQMGSGAEYFDSAAYFDDRIYQFIYTFHMPLFMLISGYFGALSIKKAEMTHTEGKLLKKRVSSLLIPIAFWTLFESIVAFVRTIAAVPFSDPTYKDQFLGLLVILGSRIPENFLNELWFLWAVLWSFLVVFISHKLFHSRRALLTACTLFFVCILFLPDSMNFGVYKYVFAFYLLGYAAAMSPEKWNGIKERVLPHPLRSLLLIAALYAILFLFFRKSILIYLSGYRLHFEGGLRSAAGSLARDLYRFLIGAAGCAFFLLLFYLLYEKAPKAKVFPLLEALGRESMGIYILSTYFIVFAVKPLADPLAPSYIRNLLESFAVLALSYALSRLLKKVPGLRKTVGG